MRQFVVHTQFLRIEVKAEDKETAVIYVLNLGIGSITKVNDITEVNIFLNNLKLEA